MSKMWISLGLSVGLFSLATPPVMAADYLTDCQAMQNDIVKHGIQPYMSLREAQKPCFYIQEVNKGLIEYTPFAPSELKMTPGSGAPGVGSGVSQAKSANTRSNVQGGTKSLQDRIQQFGGKAEKLGPWN